MEKINFIEALKRYEDNKETLILHDDGTESVAYTLIDLIQAYESGLEFGYDILKGRDSMKYLIYCIAYGKYDISFAVEAEDDKQAIEQAKQELAKDGITQYEALSIQS